MHISIITTCFNSRKLIINCIQSVKQLGDDTYEHIIIDDGSIDGTDKFINSLCDGNIVYLKYPKIGRARALNIGLKEAKGDYICILDADDLIFATNVKAVVKFLKNDNNFKTSADVIYGNVKISNLNTVLDVPHFNLIFEYSETPKYLFYICNPIPHVAVFIKRNVIVSVGGYNENRNSQLDWDLWFKIILKDMKILKVQLTLGIKYIHENQSFEKNRHFKYVTSGVALAMKHAIQSKNILFIALALIFGTSRIIWGLLPRNLRIGFWKFLNKFNYS